jgi:hypothetical protein
MDMIKIEITEPHKENPDVLVRLAGFLMECAGHKMVKAPEEISKEAFEQRIKTAEKGTTGLGDDELSVKTKDGWVSIDELPGSAPYQHCGESDLTQTTFIGVETETTDTTHKIKVPMTSKEFSKKYPNIKPDSGSYETLELQNPVMLEAGKTYEPSNTPPYVREVKKPKSRKKPKITEEIMPMPPLDTQAHCPVLPTIEIPMVNGNTLIDKIVMATSTGKLTHADVTQIVRKHGLEATKDIFTNDHLIPVINADIDEAIRGE